MNRRDFLQRLAGVVPTARLLPLLDLSAVLRVSRCAGATSYEQWRRNIAFLQGRQWIMRVQPISVADAKRRWPVTHRYRAIILPT